MRRRVSGEKQIVAVLILVTVAILGYLVGQGRSTAAHVESTREASNAVTTVNYPSAAGWQPASGAPTVAGLSIAHPLVLAPGGGVARGGLVVGQLLGSESRPLPPELLEHLRELPRAEVVDLFNTQAYRYSGLMDTGSSLTLTLYTIPTSPTGTTAIVCYASAGFSSYMRVCEQLAATLTIATGTPQVEVRTYQPLTPQAGYGRRIGAAIARVDALLGAVRAEMSPGTSRATVSRLAGRLAEGMASADESLSALAPPAAARRVHLAVSVFLKQAREAYSALGAAAHAADASGYATAQTQVSSAEARLSAALKDFVLLGYK
jgi:hypothetical protein